jgi:hypothetical protein
MTTPEPEAPQSRPLASCETTFWAFLEYPAEVFVIPVLGFTFLMFIAVIVLMITGAR